MVETKYLCRIPTQKETFKFWVSHDSSLCRYRVTLAKARDSPLPLDACLVSRRAYRLSIYCQHNAHSSGQVSQLNTPAWLNTHGGGTDKRSTGGQESQHLGKWETTLLIFLPSPHWLNLREGRVMCAHPRACMYVYMCVRRPKVNLECLFITQELSTLVFAHTFSYGQGWLVSKSQGSSCLYPCDMWVQEFTITPGFIHMELHWGK